MKKGISTFAATILLIILAISAGLVIYAYVIGYLGGAAQTDVYIDGQIYSYKNYVGVKNEWGNFTVIINNPINHTRTYTIQFFAQNNKIDEEKITVNGLSSSGKLFSQKLLISGDWSIVVLDDNNKFMDGYSFFVATNLIEADLMLNRVSQQNFTNNIAILALIISIISLFRNEIIKGIKYFFDKMKNKKHPK
jgi:hypothetical protein